MPGPGQSSLPCLDERQAPSVGELDAETVVSYAEKLWVLSPEKGLI